MNDNHVKVALISLGCAKNLVDSEIMLGSLLRCGLELTTVPEDADVLLINTCSFIQAAQEESINTILQADCRRGNEEDEEGEKGRQSQTIIVTGCLPQRFPEELPGLMPEVDAFMGVDKLEEIPQILQKAMERRRQVQGLQQIYPDLSKCPELPPAYVSVSSRPTYLHNSKTLRLDLTPRYFKYLKIAEGCNHACSFCAIPQIRGSYRSRLPEDILREVRAAVKNGCREINLISQDTTRYGSDLSRKKVKLPTEAKNLMTYLVRKMNGIHGEFWIRLLYTHPAHWTNELIEAIADCRKAVKYFDIPLQHIHPTILEKMDRRTPEKKIRSLLDKIRDIIPLATIRTTFIVGFPGETEEHFNYLLDFVREQKFQKVGVFAYSPQVGTRAALLPGRVTEAVKRRRLEKLMEVQRQISFQEHQSWIGKELPVLVERPLRAEELAGVQVLTGESGKTRGSTHRSIELDQSWWVCRSGGDAPDVDGRVYLKQKEGLKEGEFIRVKVIDCREYDLLAEAVSEEEYLERIQT